MPAVKGHTFGLRFDRETRDLTYSASVREVSEDFRADMGYLTRTGLVTFLGYLNPRIYPETDFIQKIGLQFTSAQTKDRPSGLWETSNDAAVNFFIGGSWLIRTRLNYSTEIFAGQRFQTSGIHTQLRAQMTKEFFFNIVHRFIRTIYYQTAVQGKSNVVGASITVQPSENLRADINFTYEDFITDGGGERLYDGTITRLRLTYQVNQYLFFRGIGQYNEFRKSLNTEFLASFTYIPGTVIYLGYGSIYDKVRWNGTAYVDSDRFLEMRRGLFLKMSYLWRS